MPIENAFRHQTYSEQLPLAPYELLRPRPLNGAPETQSPVGERLRQAGVERLVLVHGTFRGDDALGVVRAIERIVPSAAGRLRLMSQEVVERTARHVGNYSREYARRMGELVGSDRHDIRVSRFVWSGENHHVGRADGAVRLIDHLLADPPTRQARVLLWGHSHAGNLFALMTNLLAGPRPAVDAFFRTCEPLFCSTQVCRAERERWKRVRHWLLDERDRGDGPQLDIVTFGTPIRYGWETRGYHKLLHFVHHRPLDGWPVYRARFPFSWDDVRTARSGDYLHQLGIAGTDFPPSLVNWRALVVERRLRELLQAGHRRRDLVQRLKYGVRVADEGTVLLVDYPNDDRHLREQLLGHGIYTSPAWLTYHLDQVVNRFYGS
jgi:hypothetical protein